MSTHPLEGVRDASTHARREDYRGPRKKSTVPRGKREEGGVGGLKRSRFRG